MICVCWYATCARSTDLALMFWPRCAVRIFLCCALCCLGYDLLILIFLSLVLSLLMLTLTCSSLLMLALTYLFCLFRLPIGSPRC
jgi:hypothetical protein